MANIFITGAAGFIGFHLASKLAQRGDNVIGFDNFNDYYTPELKRQRTDLLQKQGIRVIEVDICDIQALQTAIRQHKTTHLVHLAAQAGVRYSLTNPQAYIAANVEGFVNILEVCRQENGMKLIYASSSSVYGRNDKVPFAESDRTDNQASLYGVTKKTNELLASTYHHLYKIPVTGLRFFTVYGPWGRPDMAYFSFAKAIREGQTIDIYNHGKMRRDFTYIDDIVQGTIASIDLGAECEVFNLGNHQPVELMELVKNLELALGKKAQMQFLPMQPGDVTETYADIQHSSAKLGFSPRTPLNKGIEQFISWYLDWIQVK
jgi:UDP-glucuronate 4-epimerase